MDVEFIKLEGLVTMDGDEASVQFRLHYLRPDGLSILNGGQMGWEPGYVPRPDALDLVVATFLSDAKLDLAKADEWLDSDEPRDGLVLVYDDEARRRLSP
ncbi:hypothetical protein [Conexibacter woesei]|uniref:hypothetical protein n=1 Tax=Conexibacter woesei TaxID=191495 RepID=UPI000479A3F5|nr:hypothetical protein [Conexibacter woesei]